MASTVKMERDGKAADVHPDEVSNWSASGWVEVKPAVKKKAASKPVAPEPDTDE